MCWPKPPENHPAPLFSRPRGPIQEQNPGAPTPHPKPPPHLALLGNRHPHGAIGLLPLPPPPAVNRTLLLPFPPHPRSGPAHLAGWGRGGRGGQMRGGGGRGHVRRPGPRAAVGTPGTRPSRWSRPRARRGGAARGRGADAGAGVWAARRPASGCVCLCVRRCRGLPGS